MGISVSVDSWIEQLLDDLYQIDFDSNNYIYQKIFESTNNIAEIYLIPQNKFLLISSKKLNNLEIILKKCLESLISSNENIRLISSSILTRFLNSLTDENSLINLDTFLLSNIKIFNDLISPGSYIINLSLSLLKQFKENDFNLLIQNIDYFYPIFDCLCFSMFLLSFKYNNKTLIHQFVLECDNQKEIFIEIFFNYIHLGGRSISIITLFSLLLYHPSSKFLNYCQIFLNNNGQLSNKLCELKNNETDLICLFCSLIIPDQFNFNFLNLNNENILRLQLSKIIFSNYIYNNNYYLLEALKITNSPLISAIASKNNDNNFFLNNNIKKFNFKLIDNINSMKFINFSLNLILI